MNRFTQRDILYLAIAGIVGNVAYALLMEAWRKVGTK